MDLIRLSISKPVGVAVCVILVVMFGLIGLSRIPIQLTPTVDTPLITVSTQWPGRSPQEIVDEITRPQEEELKNVSGLQRMLSVSSQGSSEITLEFDVGTDMSRARQEVSDSLRQVSNYPSEVEEPTVKVADGAAENAIAWIIIDLPEDKLPLHAGFDISTLYDALDKEVKPMIERVEGVAEVNVYGGREREVRVLADPMLLAQRQLTYGDLLGALRGQNRNVSAGTIAEGKRDYRVRLVGEFSRPEDILDTVIVYRGGLPVYVRDVAQVEVDYQKRRGFVRSLGHPSIAINVIRQSDANVVNVMRDVRAVLEEVRSDVLPNIGGVWGQGAVGPNLRLRQVYDETMYIESAINLVKTNLYIGGVLAGLVLLLFLRAIRPTAVVLIAIPISVIGTFLVMQALGRTLNVISLAGLAFAVGMVVDNAIVVLENIDRKLREGLPPLEAAYRGSREVWGAILASTLTTAAVFIPVLTIEEEAGQLFRDISLAIVASVMLSLVVSITVIPACGRWLSIAPPKTLAGRAVSSLFGVAPLLERMNLLLQRLVRWTITGWRGVLIRPTVIIVLMVGSVVLSARLMPPLDYLPAGNRNLVFGGLLTPPGLSVEQKERIAQQIEGVVGPYMKAKQSDPASLASLPPIFRLEAPDRPFDPVAVDNFFVGAFGDLMFVGATSQAEQVVIPIGSLLTGAMMGVPDSYGGAAQTSLFGRGIGGGNTIDIEISGPRLDRVTAAANFMFQAAGSEYGFGNVRANPSNFNIDEQEFQVELNERGRQLGLTTEMLGVAIRALFDGAFAGEYKLGSDTVDIMVVPPGGRLEYKEMLADIPIATPAGDVVPIDSIVNFVPALAAQQIRRFEQLPSVAVSVRPPTGEPLEAVMQTLEDKVIAPAHAAGLIDRTMRTRLEGTAAKLDDVKSAMFGRGDGKGWVSRGGAWGLFGLFLLVGLAGAAVCVARVGRGRMTLYGAAGCLLMAAVLGGLTAGLASSPHLLEARFIWALVVTYLLMAALFESFVYPFVIMFTVPLAIVGGFAGLAIVHAWSMADPTKAPQQLDVLTMLGFFILIGVVVNAAILLVHQSLNFMREEGLAPADAIGKSVRTRVRPIFMSVLTSVGGMMPLVIAPGSGSEMYRGLGSVVVGGLLASSVLTLALAPMVFSLVLDMRAGMALAFEKRARSPRPVRRPIKPASASPASESGSTGDSTPAAEPAEAVGRG
ncbi:MAG: efflux RND transporter permease subunit [Phycisphaeraceae bacterium]|nr:efflux RND transporter permease subunit [Phycisphaeraceae bacterium]MCW5763742.1 efflux RND transporter permease subunit [Phycisphaeraceae bacterium]